MCGRSDAANAGTAASAAAIIPPIAQPKRFMTRSLIVFADDKRTRSKDKYDF
jgi:hypothetical protein